MKPHQKHWLGKPEWVKKEEKKIDWITFFPLVLIIPCLIISFNQATFPEPDHDYSLRVVGTVRDIDYTHDKILLEFKDGGKMGYQFRDQSHFLQNNTEYIFQYAPGLGTIADSGYSMKEIYQMNNDWTWIDELYRWLGWANDFKHDNIMIGDPNVFQGGCIEN